MGADFGDRSSVEDDHEVGSGDGGEAVGDQEGDGAASSCLACGCDVALEEAVFCGGVECGGGFVEDEQEWFWAHHAARDREALPLPAGQVDAGGPGAAELGVQALGEGVEYVFTCGAAEGGVDRGPVLDAGR